MTGLGLGVASCGSEGNGEKLGERVIPLGQPVPKGGGVYRTGNPYQVAGVWYYPQEDRAYDRVGTASWYGELFQGRRTANGEIYDMDRLSAAHPTLPLPVYAQVTNLHNGRSIVVRVNDRGPYANDRILDLSRRSAELLGYLNKGTATVRVQYLRRAPLNGDDSYERRYAASQRWVQVAAKGPSRRAAQDPRSVASLPKAAGGLASAASVSSAPERVAAGDGRLLIQAGSFKHKANADRARSQLAELAPVEVTQVEAGGEVYFRVRVGPFKGGAEAATALAQVTQAGYVGAKLVLN